MLSLEVHFVLAHGHGVDGGVQLVDGKGFAGAEFFAAVSAEENDGEVAGCDVEAAADGFGFRRCKAGGGRRGVLIGKRDGDEVAIGSSGGVLVEGAELDLELWVVGFAGKDQQNPGVVAERGE